MGTTTWKQAVYDIADAYREAEGTEDKISIANLKEKVREGSSKVTLDGEKVKELAMTSYQGDNPLTIGADGVTFDPNVLLKAGLTILNGVSGEDLTDPIALLSEAVAENLRLAKSKYAENNGAGAYVWKKLTAEGGDFVDYVISDASDAYPDGGTQDGYYYAKFDPLQAIAENIREGINVFDIIGTMAAGVNLSGLGLSKCEMVTTTHSADTYINWTTVNHPLDVAPKVLYVRAKTTPSGNCSSGHHLTHAIISNVGPVSFAIYLGRNASHYSVGYNSTQAYSLTASNVKLGNCGIDAASNVDGTSYNNLNYLFASGVVYEFYVLA